MRRVALVIPVVVLGVSFAAVAAEKWDHGGSDVGRFGSAIEACRDQLGTSSAYKVVEATPADARGYSRCIIQAKDKGDGKTEPPMIDNGAVYRIGPADPNTPAAGASGSRGGTSQSGTGSNRYAAHLKEGCDEKMVAGWFPTFKGSSLESFSAGVDPAPKIGGCFNETDIQGRRLFVSSKGSVRADRMLKEDKASRSNHYHLKTGNLIVDPTIFQFFQRKPGFNGLVFVGTDDQLLATLNKLVATCGINQETEETLDQTTSGPDPKKGTRYRLEGLFGKSGRELKTLLFDGATVKSSGACLKMRPSGTAADYQSNCTTGAGGSKGLP